MKLTIALILSVALLGGCATTSSSITVPKEVKIEVPVPCKTEEPAEPTLRFAPPYNDIFEAVRDLMGDQEVRTAYENELRIALKSCK